MGSRDRASIAQARHDALEGIQQLLVLVEDIPSVQLRLMMQAACLDVATSIEELSDLTSRKLLGTQRPLGSSGEVA
ncbi:MAG: hypothetical protein KDD70_18920 [Bdellovibrionales bacterium]|nr:hypothetical protein [Bdellovibrionales bacterium]